MSFNVEVIPEDPTFNGAILQPLVQRIVAEAGRPNANITVLTNPRATGYDHVIGLMTEDGGILDRYRRRDLLLFLPDGDGKDRTADFTRLETLAAAKGAKLVCCAAVEEVETWLLAGHLDKLNAPWATVRADPSVKENHFFPVLDTHGDSRRASGGRDLLMLETLGNYAGLKARCPELQTLEDRIRAVIQGGV